MSIYKAELSIKFDNPIGKEFYTFYLERSNRGTRFNVDTGIFKVRVIKESSKVVFKTYQYEVIEIFGKPKGLKDTLEGYINNFHACSANYLFSTYEEAIENYDENIKDMMKNPDCNDRELELLYKKLIKLMSEKDKAIEWYNSLKEK